MPDQPVSDDRSVTATVTPPAPASLWRFGGEVRVTVCGWVNVVSVEYVHLPVCGSHIAYVTVICAVTVTVPVLSTFAVEVFVKGPVVGEGVPQLPLHVTEPSLVQFRE
jgi:hypothetical protein